MGSRTDGSYNSGHLAVYEYDEPLDQNLIFGRATPCRPKLVRLSGVFSRERRTITIPDKLLQNAIE